jgi:ElaB/YqjD/DUF883 family membrane-anchored ribosome-binding protein
LFDISEIIIELYLSDWGSICFGAAGSTLSVNEPAATSLAQLGRIMTTAAPASANDQLRQKAHEIKENIVDLAGIANDAARGKLSELKDEAASRCQSGIDKAGKVRDGIVAYVKDNPGKSVLACVLAGALVGYLVSRRR